jgi:hypothetical protein
MDHEIVFRPVGDASKAGDSILVRYVEEGVSHLIVIDGGTDDSGQSLVDYIKYEFGSDVVIDHVISTHPDSDHACGLRAVMTEFTVSNLWLHGVWHHADEMLEFFDDKRWSADGLAKAIRTKYGVIEELIRLANDQGTVVREPFQGAKIGPFTVLSPSRYAYIRLVPQFRKTPACDNEALQEANMHLGTKYYGEDMASIGALAKALLARVMEFRDA